MAPFTVRPVCVLFIHPAAGHCRRFISGAGGAGPLPEAWADSRAMPRLKVLSLSNCSLTGTLPPAWATGFPALQSL